MAPNPPSLFIPKSKSRPGPTSPTSPQQRVGLEELKREMMRSDPEAFQNESKFGPIPGITVGAIWNTRDECAKARIHIHTKAGISGGRDGAYSIVMSGGYEDDIDGGDSITYTGAGGREDDDGSGGGSGWGGGGVQTRDQSFTHKDNNALRVSWKLGKPVRVIRGSNLHSKYAPRNGYRYDGIYKVTKAYMDKSKSGVFQICRYELVREPGQPPIPTQWN